MSQRQLFLDLHQVTRIEGLYRRIHQPQRHRENPILKGENPWEKLASLYGTVLRDPSDELFKMWYLTGPMSMGRSRCEDDRRWAISRSWAMRLRQTGCTGTNRCWDRWR